MRAITFTAALLIGGLTGASLPARAELPAYQKVGGISGNLNSVGSDTLNNLMTYWAEGFRKQYPSVNIQIEGKGSSTAPPALLEGTAQLGPMSRPMKREELKKFEDRFGRGFAPTPIRVGVDALAVYVHKDNPMAQRGMTLAQVDAVFSANRKRGHPEVRTWGDLGLTGRWASKPISIYGRNSASGTYGFFKKVALDKGDFRNTVKQQPGSAAVVQGVENDRYAIGYSGIGYKTSGVAAVPLAESGDTFAAATFDNVYSGKYPLSRFLLVYVKKDKDGKLTPTTREFLRFVLSREGQAIVAKDGYGALPAAIVKQELNRVNGQTAE